MNTGVLISQLLIFNAVKRHRDTNSDATATRHDPHREPPVPVYLGLLVHVVTRKKPLVDKHYRLGLSILYDRVMQITANLGNGVITQFEEEGVVCPSKLKKITVQHWWRTWTILMTTQSHLQRRTHFTELQSLLPNTLLMTYKALAEIERL